MAQPYVSLRRLCRFPLQSFRPSICSRLPPSAHIHISHRLLRKKTQETELVLRGLDSDAFTNDVARGVCEEWAKFSKFPNASRPSEFVEGEQVTVHGFLSARRVKGAKLAFVNIQVDNGPVIQVTSAWEQEDSPQHRASKALRGIPLYSPVSVTGVLHKLHDAESTEERNSAPPSTTAGFPSGVSRIDLELDSVQPLNEFPRDIIVSKGVQFPPTARHLQIRFSEALRSRLLARPKIGLQLRKTLDNLGLTEVETPILFKSTPEGAREFIVPTRRPGLAYALPQSPQQYKQMLMCSGIRGYFQFARCFRDEDLRADRQPEFTQLDLEMGFATGEDVMNAVESLISELPAALNAQFSLVEKDGDIYPVSKLGSETNSGELQWPSLTAPFLRITYDEAMSRFGVDKPDLRIPFEIRRVDQVLPAEFIGKITGKVETPIVDTFRFRPDPEKMDLKSLSKFIDEFMTSLPSSLSKNPDGLPAPILYDSKRPLAGLSSLGFEGVDGLTSGAQGLEDFTDLEDGDIIFFQARENIPFQGGSTAIGRVRTLFYQEAVSRGFLPRNLDFKFLWVTHFPMFTPNNETETDPGQGGQAGFSSTHHPFTAPLTDQDAKLLLTDPLKAKADHYDLVVNGVELGGGSRRIHQAIMQEYVMREILKMTDEGFAQFSHLLEALRAGCPPHAGFALGFDRLVAVFTHTDSVRDVIAFPKSMKGEDLTVKSPGKITSEQLGTYHLAFGGKK